MTDTRGRKKEATDSYIFDLEQEIRELKSENMVMREKLLRAYAKGYGPKYLCVHCGWYEYMPFLGGGICRNHDCLQKWSARNDLAECSNGPIYYKAKEGGEE